MKKPSSRIREEIARLQEQLKAAETREAERIGRIALKAGLGDIEIDEDVLLTAFAEVAARFRNGGSKGSTDKKPTDNEPRRGISPSQTLATGAAQPSTGEVEANG